MLHVLRIGREQFDRLGHRIVSGPIGRQTGETAARTCRRSIALRQDEVRNAVLGVQVAGLARSGGSARNVVGHEAHQRDAHEQFLTLGGVFLDIQRLVQVGLRLCIVLLVLESLGQEHGRLRRRLHLIVFLGDREVEITVALGARHQSHGLRKQRLVVGSGGQLALEESFEILAACGAAQSERSVELALVLGGSGVLLEERRQTVVLGDDLVGHHLVGIPVIVAEVREIGHDGLGIGVVAAGLDGCAERFADTLAVGGFVHQILTGLAVEDIGRAVLGMVAEILVAQVVNDHQRVGVGVFLGDALGARDLVLIKRDAAHEGILRSLRTFVEQLLEVMRGSVVILVVERLLEEVAVQNVLLPLLRSVTPDRVLRITEILLCHRCDCKKHTRSRKQEFNVFHRSD